VHRSLKYKENPLGWGTKDRKLFWIKWESVCKPKEEGGLEIKKIGKFNIALLAKWERRLGMDNQGLWKEILESKYDTWRNMSRTDFFKNVSV